MMFACMFKSGAFHPLRRHHNEIAGKFGDGQIVLLEDIEERSEASHRHEFAWLREAWLTLPESMAGEYRSPEHLRKKALIATGYCTQTDYVCATKAEAARWAVNLKRELNEYDLVIVSESVVRVVRPKSQSRKAMPGGEFQQSKTAILEWVSGLIGVTPAQLSEARAA